MSESFNLIYFLEKASNKGTGLLHISGSSEEHFVPYSELSLAARKGLGFLQSKGIQKGAELIFQIEDNESFVTVFWSCLLGGIIPVPINSAFTPETRTKLINVWNTLQNPYIITEEKAYSSFGPKIQEEELNVYDPTHLLHVDHLLEWDGPEGEVEVIDVHETAFIQFSSGSTGSPKGVVLTHGNLIINILAIANCSDLTSNDSTLGWMPLTHDLGLIGFHLTPLLLGINQYLIPTSAFIRRPSLWLAKINEHRVSFTASPNFGYKHFMAFFKDEVGLEWDLSCIRRILNGAEPISASLCDEFLDRMEPFGLKRNTMFPVYGMAEASLAVAFPEPGRVFESISLNRNKLKVSDQIEKDENGISFVCVGKAVDDCYIRISNKNYIPLKEGYVGHVEIRGGNVTKGYYNNPEANKAAFSSDNWLRTGDLGFFCDGKLFITGRSKDIIFSNGQNLYPHDIERLAEGVEGVELGKVVVCGCPNQEKHRDDILAFVFFKGKPEEFVDLAIDLKSHINRRLSIELDAILPVKSIEKTTSGKVRRFFYAENYANGVYNELADKVHNLILNKLKARKRVKPGNDLERAIFDLWVSVLGREDIGIHENFFELGGNSLKANILIGRVARDMKLELSIREVFKSPTIAALASIIKDKKEQSFASISRVSNRQFYPCSPVQRRMYVLHKLDPDSLNYNVTNVHKITGKVDVKRLEMAFSKLLERHDILRTYFSDIDGDPVQKVADIERVVMENIELKTTLQDTVDAWIKPFSIQKAPLFKVALIREEADVHYLVFDIHHIIADGYSLNLIIKELGKLYSGGDVEPVSISYIDYSVWQEDFYSGEEIQRQKKYWLSQFDTEIPTLNFPTDFTRSNHAVNKGGCLYFDIDKEIYQGLINVATDYNSTFYTLLLTGLNIVLAKYSGQEDIVIGTPVTSRPHIDLQSVFGPFINTLALRNTPAHDKTVAAFHEELKENLLNAFTNQNYPFEQLVNALDLERDVTRNALFDVLFVLQNANEEELHLKDLKVEQVDYHNGDVKLDLNIHARESEHGFKIKIEYSGILFREETIQRFGSHYIHTLRQIVSDFEQPIGKVKCMTSVEEQAALECMSGALKPFAVNNALQLFLNQVVVSPNSSAVRYKNHELSYFELDQISNYYAVKLKDAGVESGDFVGISFEPSHKVCIAMIAIWKVGAAFVPIDPGNPKERKEIIVEDSGIKAIFTDNDPFGITAFDIETDYRREDAGGQNLVWNNDSVAYIIYTSGTTGKPKGVLVRQSALANYSQWLKDHHLKTTNNRSLMLTSYAFDLGYTSLFGMLLNGGCICWMDEADRKEPNKIVDFIVEKEISFIKTTPSQLFTLINATNFERLKEATLLSRIFTGGEAVKVADIRQVLALKPDVQFVNHYGPTESTIGCITKPIQQIDQFEENPVIGKPIDNVQALILNKEKQLVPIGVEGEIHIAGAGLALGYHNRPEDYKLKFIEHPFKANEKLYATGDVGKLLSGGEIRFLGRNDDQLKIRGYRVELKGVESKLRSLNGVDDVLVLGLKDHQDNNFLCAYIISEQFEKRDFRAEASDLLPEYMVPSYFMKIEAIPITANGKLDKSQLPDPEVFDSGEKILPYNDVQKKLGEIWKFVLGLKEEVGVNQNFFELGGHSLKATIVIAKIHKEFNAEIPLKVFFSNPTILALESILETAETNPYAEIPLAEVKNYYPVSSAQKRMYVLNQLEGEATSYNMPGAFWVTGPLNYERLRNTFDGLIRRHESLRTSFDMKSGEPIQIINYSYDFEVDFIDGKGEPVDIIIYKFIRSFDLSKAPLFRVGVYKESEHRHLLLFDIHHIISDGSSMGLIIRDFVELYDGRTPKELRIQYKDFTVWQKEFYNSDYLHAQRTYWLREFARPVSLLDLPTDFERPKVQRFEGESFTFQFDEKLTSSLKKVCNDQGVTMFMVLFTVYNLFLARQTGQSEFVVGTPIAGRPHEDLQNLIGVFLNTLAIKTNPEKDKKVLDFLHEVKDKSLKAYENQDYPFDELVQQLELDRYLNRNPLFDTMLVVQNMDIADLSTQELQFEQYEFDLGSAQLDLSIIVFENDKTLDFTINYSTNLFSRETVETFVERLRYVALQLPSKLEGKVADIEIITLHERKQILLGFNDTESYYDRSVNVFDKFRMQVQAHPDKVAIMDDQNSITYQQLDRYSCAVAAELNHRGVQKGQIVPLSLGRSVDTVICILGVLKTGAAYVFVDPNYPLERIEFMLSDCDSDLVITESAFKGKISPGVDIVLIDELNVTNLTPKEQLLPKYDPDDLAYLIYTSGSTGKPKGVQISHNNLNSFVHWCQQEFANTDFEIVYNATSYSFDLSIFEIFFSLCSGKSVRIMENGLRIPDYLHKDRKVLLNTVPVVIKELLLQKTDLSNVTAINMAGEPIPQYVKDNLDFDRMEIRNLYGPSEDTTYSTCYRFEKADKIQNIGKPITNTQAYVLGEDNRLMPIGVAGELCLAGEGVSNGYLKRPDLTLQRFVHNRLGTEGYMYRTGDLVKWLPNGNLEYLGRIDNQVKIRGFRIELGEIEQRLYQHPEIADCVVADIVNEETDDKLLCAYYISKHGNEVQQLRVFLAEHLPAHMVPNAFVLIEEIPTTPNGKVDKKALPFPDLFALQEELVLPTTEIEQTVLEAWKKVLGSDQVGMDSNFFSLGGDSIKAIQVASYLKEHNLKVDVRQFFEYPTIASLIPHVKQSNTSIDQREVIGEFEYGPVQKMFFEKNFNDKNHWNQSVILRSKEVLSLEQLEHAFQEITRHHDMLRARFITDEAGEITAFQKPNLHLERIEIESAEEAFVYADKIQRSLDIENGKLFNAIVFFRKGEDHLLIVCHHLVVDGISWRIIIADLQKAYRGEVLSQKTNSFKTWTTAWKKGVLSGKCAVDELDYWLEIEQNATSDFATSGLENKMKGANKLTVQLNEQETADLTRDANVAYNTEINDLLLTGLVRAFYKWNNTSMVTINLEGHGREQVLDEPIEIDRTIGWFTSMFPVNLDYTEELRDQIIKIKDVVHRIPNRGVGYGALRYYGAAELNLNPGISFNYLGDLTNNDEDGMFTFSTLPAGNNIGLENQRLHTFDFNGAIKNGQLSIELTYNQAYSTQQEVEILLDFYKSELNSIAQHCLHKDEAEVTASDMSFEISLDDFDNIF